MRDTARRTEELINLAEHIDYRSDILGEKDRLLLEAAKTIEGFDAFYLVRILREARPDSQAFRVAAKKLSIAFPPRGRVNLELV